MRDGLRSFADFESCIDGFLARRPAAWPGRRAASLARRAGACDHLITAALVHDFAACLGEPAPAGGLARRSAELLGGVFPAQVLAPLRLVGAAAPVVAAAPLLAQTRRLHRFIDGAQASAEGALLPWTALRSIARRASLDG
jgi:hypothetical protein